MNLPFTYFTASEKRGSIVLVLLLAGITLGIHWMPRRVPQRYLLDAAHLDSLTRHWDSLRPLELDSSELALYAFDPNTATRLDLMRLGLSERVANNVLNYRKKGGKYRKPADFARTWDLDSLDFVRLAPYIRISSEYTQARSSKADSEGDFALFDFDPNTATPAQLSQLGLPNRVIDNIVKYRSKGGKFYDKQDFQKLYGLDEATYQRLAPYLVTDPYHDPSDKPLARNINDYIELEVNSASAAEWTQFRGIGEKTAQRIVNYRQKLGGFHSIDQVGTTWGLDPDLFANIKPQLRLDPSRIRKMPINTVPLDTLAAHPAIKHWQAQIIINYRTHHGPFQSLKDLKKIKVVDAPLYDALTPYLRVD